MENDLAARRRRLPDCRRCRRQAPLHYSWTGILGATAMGIRRRAHRLWLEYYIDWLSSFVGLGDRDALYWLGLLARRIGPSDRGRVLKLVYFAWVRERIGKAEEELAPPQSVATIGELMRWLAQRGEEYAYAFENPKI